MEQQYHVVLVGLELVGFILNVCCKVGDFDALSGHKNELNKKNKINNREYLDI